MDLVARSMAAGCDVNRCGTDRRRRQRTIVAAVIAAGLCHTAARAQQNAFGVPNDPAAAPVPGYAPQMPPAPPQPGPFGGQPSQPPFGGQPSQPPFGGQPSQPPFGGQPAQQPFAGQPSQPPFGGQPSQAPGGPSLSVQQYIVSVWRGQIVDQTGSWNVVVSFNADGSFFQQQMLANGQFQISIMGRYSVQLQSNVGLLQFSLQDWQPRQYCAGYQNCQPINLPPTQSVPFRPLGRDLFETEYGRFQRAGMAQ